MPGGSFLGLLDLKKDATIGLDGQTIVLRTDDFVGVSGVDQGFHLATVRALPNASIAVGLIMVVSGSGGGGSGGGDQHQHQHHLLPLVRKYDPRTEEISSQPVDVLTAQNLVEQVRNGQMPPTSVVDYSKVVSSDHKQQWNDQTKFILDSGILRVRGLENGDKIIPGSYHDDEGDESSSNLSLSRPKNNILDGKSVTYPSIPVVDTNISLRNNRHAGTKRHLSGLSPSERTRIFLEPKIASRLLRDVLSLHYGGRWESLLGDLQLAYILFLFLQCLASLEHWKDLVAMLSLVEPSGMKEYPQMYTTLLQVLPSQLSSMDQGFLEDVDEAGNNFLLPSLKTLCRNVSRAKIVDEQNMLRFQRLLSNKFPTMMVVDDEEADENDEAEEDLRIRGGRRRPVYHDEDYDDDDGDSDGPVVVDMVDIEASMARTSESNYKNTRHQDNLVRVELSSSVIAGYPLLVAAILPHEDILMTCARALDERKDVSLVREASAYLEEMEQKL